MNGIEHGCIEARIFMAAIASAENCLAFAKLSPPGIEPGLQSRVFDASLGGPPGQATYNE
jgi:hypothetical protein